MAIRFPFRIKKFVAIFVIAAFFVTVFHLHFKSRTHEYKFNRQLSNKKRLAILVPFRDRFDELLSFVPYISKFLLQQDISSFSIHILNQSARYRFNRGALANAGFHIVRNQSDYIAIHDVDLVPLNQNLSYQYPEKGPYHMTSPEYHPMYNYEKYFGGILLISNVHFELVNGFSNRYFGWGLEDDEFYTRIQAAKLPIFRPHGLNSDRNSTFLHFHHNRKRDIFKTKDQREALKYRDRITGLDNLRFSITSTHDMSIDRRYPFKVHNIELHCDTEQTPWCLTNYSKSTSPRQQRH